MSRIGRGPLTHGNYRTARRTVRRRLDSTAEPKRFLSAAQFEDRSTASITFIAAAPHLFAAYVSHMRDDGYAVSQRELKSDAFLGGIPLVMLASFDSLDDTHAALEMGACDYIIKTETSAWALSRGVPTWARIDRQLQAGLQKSAVKRGGADRARVAFWARPRLAAADVGGHALDSDAT